MSKEFSVTAPANIAFIKYWGARDLASAVPQNPSISMTLRACVSHTTVRVLPAGAPDEVWLATDAGLVAAEGSFRERACAHLARLREWAGVDCGLAAATRNSFPAGAGIASSASGFAALTVATLGALGVEASASELSILARRSGSGSASRSVLGGYVLWPDGDDDEAPASQIATAEHWDLRDLVVLVQTGEKKVSSLDGHRRAHTSPHYERRQDLLPARLDRVQRAIRDRDLDGLGPVLEEDAIELHLIAMSSSPAIFYWLPATLRVLEAVRNLRADGVPAWSTMDAGANVHVLCEPGSEDDVFAALSTLRGVHDVIRDGAGSGPEVRNDSLFDGAR
jgi:diphosphomevalonate decarboxylase